MLYERWKMTKTIRYSGQRPDKVFDIWENPTKKELREAMEQQDSDMNSWGSVRQSSTKSCRGLITKGGKGKLYVFSSDFLHSQASRALDLPYEDYENKTVPVHCYEKNLAFAYRTIVDLDDIPSNSPLLKTWWENTKKNPNVKRLYGNIKEDFTLSEKYLTAVKNRYEPDTGHTDVWINPTTSEWKEALDTLHSPSDRRAERLRGLIDRGGMGDLYIFSTALLHDEALRSPEIKGKTKGEILPVYIEGGNKYRVSGITLYSLYPKWDQADYDDVIAQYDNFWSKNIEKNKNCKIMAGSKKVEAMPWGSR